MTELVWAVCEESSDPIVNFEGRRVRVDQMKSTGHLARLGDGLADIAGLGVRFIRYGSVCRLRENGLPCVGICWYSRGDQHDWHTGLVRPAGEVTPVGLFDMERRPRPSAATIRELALRGCP